MMCLSQIEEQLRANGTRFLGAEAEEWNLTIPLRIRNGCNMREHPMARHRRVKNERSLTGSALWYRQLILKRPRPSLPCVVTMTRLAPRALDYVNLVAGLKGVQDEIAAWLGITDAPDDTRAKWVFEQEKAKGYACKIEIEEAP